MDTTTINRTITRSTESLASEAGAATARVGTVAVTVESGPAVDTVTTVGVGSHVIGRSSRAAVRVEDPLVEPHHALLRVADDGVVTLLQLAGRVPLRVDGVPAAGPVVVGEGACIDYGASRIRLGAPPPDAQPPHTGEVPGDPWRRMVVRSPRTVPFMAVATVEPPAPRDPSVPAGGVHAGMLMGAVGGIMTGLVMAMITGSSIMAVFGLVAGLVSFATWTTARIRTARDRARRRREQAVDLDEFVAAVGEAARRIRSHHVAAVGSVAQRLAAAETNDLWSRRRDHGDAFDVTLGRGDVERPVPIGGSDPASLSPELASVVERHRTLRDVAVSVSLDARDHYVLAVERDGAWGVVRSIVLQLAVATGPADWCIRGVVRDPAAHRWIERLPHASTADGRPALVDSVDAAAVADAVTGLDDGDPRRVVVVCDAPSLLATRTGPVRRLLDGDRPVTVLLVVDDGSSLPAVCTSTVGLGARSTARWIPDLHDAAAVSTWCSTRLHVSGVSHRTAVRVAARLERYVDPEDPSSTSSRLPSVLRLGDLPGVPGTVDEIVEAWSAAGDDPAPSAVVGMSVDGVIEIDLVRDGPHGLVAGTTGSGKSELLRTLAVSMAARVPPSQLALVLVDYKGGSTFDALSTLPHTVGVVTDLDDGLAARALVSLDAELHRREVILREHGASDLTAYRALPGVAPLARLVVVIDEFAALAKELPDFLSALVGIAQRGRSLGIHLVLATQRPAGVIDDAIRANTNLRLALRLNDVADAIDVVGDRSPATFARGVPGRALLRLGPDDVVEFQAAAERDLEALAALVRHASARLDVEPPHRPWLPPLGDVGDLPVEPGAIGIVDDPAGQRRLPLRWRATGNLALVGALGSGTTTTLVALAASLAPGRPGGGCDELYVIDGRGDTALDVVDRFARCAGVVRLHEHERVDRMLHRLAMEIDRRRAIGSVTTAAVLLVDGLAALRRSLDDPGRGASLAALDRLLAEGPGVGVVTAAVVEPEGGSIGSLLGRFAERWVFHLDDPGAGPMIGVPAGRIPPAVPGRLVVAGSGLEAQARRPPDERPSATAHVVDRVTVLPATVRPDDVGSQGPAGTPVGLRFDDLSVAHLDLVGGDRVVVAGPARSGRSTLLIHLVDQWRSAHPDGVVAVVCGSERSPLAGCDDRCDVAALGALVAASQAHGTSLLVAVDDAERVDDEQSVLARLAADRPGGVTAVYLTGRADALRSTFDHWTVPARKQRVGLVMTATADLDADVLGTPPPRRCPITPRPGLAWMIAHGECALVQTVSRESTIPG